MKTKFYSNLGIGKYTGPQLMLCFFTELSLRSIHCTLLAKFADSVDLKDGLLNNKVCTVKFLVVESYFSCNTTHTV